MEAGGIEPQTPKSVVRHASSELLRSEIRLRSDELGLKLGPMHLRNTTLGWSSNAVPSWHCIT